MLKDEGGFAFTHNGYACKVDEVNFDAKDARNVLTALNWFLSFCRGHFCGPAIARGYNRDGVCLWEEFNVRRMGPWKEDRNI